MDCLGIIVRKAAGNKKIMKGNATGHCDFLAKQCPLTSVRIHVGATAKCSLEPERVVLPEEIHARVVFGCRLWLVFIVSCLRSLDGRDGLAVQGSGWHECVDGERRPVLVPRL